MLCPLLDRLAAAGLTVKLRMDAGLYSAALLRMLESYPNVSYEIAVPQHKWLQEKIRSLNYKSYHQSQRQYCSLTYASCKKGFFRYFYVERTAKPMGSQIDLFDPDRFNYLVVVSNQVR